MNRIVFIIGGARSGKSRSAETLALQISRNTGSEKDIAYIATGERFDPEFAKRIQNHRDRRAGIFKTYEESMDIAGALRANYDGHSVFILECLTTWLGNLFFKMKALQIEDFVNQAIEEISSIFSNDRSNSTESPFRRKFKYTEEQLLLPADSDKTLIVVSNEVGQGIVPADQMSRDYRDFHGRMNQKMASCSDFAYLITAGMPSRLK